ncbi:hypothetical protein OAJ74_00055 [Alphaproteobacteria bacterium]|nr:hypothetical protein [Alphaproteobacteria bacterium]
MRYFSAISSLVFLNILAVLSLLHLGNVSREIEKQNYTLEKKINFINDQININEIEYSLYNNYEYLKILHKIYFDSEEFESFSIKRLSFNDIKKKKFEDIYTVGTQ